MKIPIEFRVVNAIVMVKAVVSMVVMLMTGALGRGQFGIAEYAVFLIPFNFSVIFLLVTIGVEMSATLAIAWVPFLGVIFLLKDFLSLMRGDVSLVSILLVCVYVLWVYFAVQFRIQLRQNLNM